MPKKSTLVAAAVAAAVTLTAPVAHADTATPPATVYTGGFLYPENVNATVTVDQAATIQLTTKAAYTDRIVTTVKKTVAATGPGTYLLAVPCKYTRLPMTWTVTINDVATSSAILRCA